MSHPLFERHRATLAGAVRAIRSRECWSAYPEVPSGKIYGETAKDEGKAAFDARLNKPFALDQPGTVGRVGAEVSPFGTKLGVTYPKADLDALLPAAQKAISAWRKAGVETRVGVALEILHRLNRRSFEIANAVMHTTGQAFMMAFQAGGPHAQDRALEAVAYAYEEMSRIPQHVTWTKQVSKTEVVRLDKTFTIVPRGVAVVVGCSTFPTWNSYPGLFASLVTGNAVVVKPHPGAILPLAMTVQIARDVLEENGLDPNLVTLAADAPDQPITKTLVARPEVKIVDYTGSSGFGSWIEENAKQAVVFTEKAGVNSAIIDSCDDLKAMTGNLAFTVSLYSGQMCTRSQNIYIPRSGVMVGGQRKTFDEVAAAIVGAINWLLGDQARAVEILGCIQNETTIARIEQAAKSGAPVLLESKSLPHPQFPQARIRTPLVLKVEAKQRDQFMREMFGPIVYVVATDSTEQSIALARESAQKLGAITWALYSTDAGTIGRCEDAAVEAGVPLSVNLTGQIYVNQAAAFSDYHVSGGNPSGNATLTDAAFVAPRFHVVQSRMPARSAAVGPAEIKPAATSVSA